MYLIHKSLLTIHVTVGAIALALFWLPIVARKGSDFHRRSGRWFVNGMVAVALTSVAMATLSLIDPIGVRFTGDPASFDDPESVAVNVRVFSLFLLMLAVLVVVSVRHGVLVLEVRDDRSRLRATHRVAAKLVLFALALIVGGVGLRFGEPLLMIFAVVGAVGAIGMLRYTFKPTLSRNEWWIEHLGNMIGGGIAAYTAFFAFGGRRFLAELLTGHWMIVPWVVPAIVGTIAIAALSRRYRRRFASR